MKKGNLSTLVDDIYFGELDRRIQNCLYHYRVETLRQLVAYSRTDILKMRDMGAISRAAIENWLEARGLHLGMTEEEIAEYEGVTVKTEEEQAAADAPEVLSPNSQVPSVPVEEVSASSVKSAANTKTTPSGFISDEMKCEIYRFAANLILERSKIKEKYPSCLDTLEGTIAAMALYSEIKKELKKLKE